MRTPAIPGAKGFLRKCIAYFRDILSTPSASVICILLAVLGKISLLKYYFIISNDRIYQAVAAQNWLRGMGFTINSVHANNLSKELIEPLVGYPIGYSILLVPLYSIFKDFETAALVLDLFSGILFLLVLRQILKSLGIPIHLINFSILFHGFAIPVYIVRATPTDLLTASLCLLNVYLCIRLIQTTRKFYWYGLTIGVIAVLSGLLRYMYVPLLFFFPLFILLNGHFKRDKKLLYSGLICFSIIILGIFFSSIGFYRAASLFVSGNSYIGNLTHVYQSGKSFYPENLTSFYPFAADSFSNSNFILTQLSIHTGLSYIWWLNFCRIICLPIQILFFAGLLIFIGKKKGISSTPQEVFLNLGGMICIITMAILVYLSLTKKGYVPPPLDFYWTFIGEGRYYGFVSIYFYISFLIWVVNGRRSYTNRFRTIAIIVFFLLTVSDSLHGMYYVSKLYFKYGLKNPDYAKFAQARNFIQEQLKRENGARDLIVASAHATTVGNSILSGGKGMFLVDEINSTEIRSDKPAILLAVIEKARLKHFHHFLSRKDVQMIKAFGDLYFYSCSVNPGNAN